MAERSLSLLVLWPVLRIHLILIRIRILDENYGKKMIYIQILDPESGHEHLMNFFNKSEFSDYFYSFFSLNVMLKLDEPVRDQEIL